MDREQGTQIQRIKWLVVTVAILQIAAVCLIIRFGFETVGRDRTLLHRTETMMQQIFPGIEKSLSDVSGKAAEINQGVVALRSQLSGVEELVDLVGKRVTEVHQDVRAVDRNLSGYVNDTSGLVWGHALNPYLLMGLLAAVMLCVLLSAWVSVKRIKRHAAGRMLVSDKIVGRIDGISSRLDELSLLVQRMKTQSQMSTNDGKGFKDLVEETDRLIACTRNELAMLSGQATHPDESDTELPGSIH